MSILRTPEGVGSAEVATYERSGPAVAGDPGTATPDRRRMRLGAEPYGRGMRWGTAETVLAAFDAVALILVTRSLLAVLVGLSAQRMLGAYQRRFHLTAVDGERRTLAVAALVTLTAILGTSSPGWVLPIALFLLSSLALFLARAGAIVVIHFLRRRRAVPVMVLGGGPLGMTLVETLARHPEYGLTPVGVVSDVGVRRSDLPVVPTHRARQAIAEAGVKELICAFGPQSDAENARLLRSLQSERVRLSIIPRLFDLSPTSDHIWGIPLLEVPTALSDSTTRRVVKRVLELVIVSSTLVLAAPVMFLCAVAVKATSPGPVFYRQKRVGIEGKEFMILKFRTMAEDAEGPSWTLVDDPRVTKVGSVLRRTGLDELPQLLNVLKGDMSLIGPRPLRIEHVREGAASIPTFRERERVRAGVTGLAEAYGLRGGDVSAEERTRFDNLYIDRQSLIMDAFIMLKSIASILRGHSY